MRRMAQPVFLGFLLTAAAVFPGGAAAQPVAQVEWRKVDSLPEGRKVSVALRSGEIREGRFVAADAETLTLRQAKGVEETIRKSSVAQVAARRPAAKAAGLGAMVGGLGLFGWLNRAASLCGTGCENDMPAGAGLLMAGVGAGIGSLIGAAASIGPDEVLFPYTARSGHRYPLVRVAAGVGQGTFRSYAAAGHTATSTVSAGVMLSPRMSVQMEWTRLSRSTFLAPNAGLHDQIISGAVPAESVSRQEEHSARVPHHLAGLVGFHPKPWGRLQLGVLGGLSVQPRERLVFESFKSPSNNTGQPRLRTYRSAVGGLVIGLDAQIAVTHGLAVVPYVRHDRGFGSRAGANVAWSFPSKLEK